MVESGKIFPLRYLSPIRAESGMYWSVSFWHRADKLTEPKVSHEREAEIAAKKLTTDTVSIHISQDEAVPLISLGLRNN